MVACDVVLVAFLQFFFCCGKSLLWGLRRFFLDAARWCQKEGFQLFGCTDICISGKCLRWMYSARRVTFRHSVRFYNPNWLTEAEAEAEAAAVV